MSVVKLRGIILKEEFKGESNKRIIIFSKDSGRKILFATGARKSKSPLLAATQIFSYCDFYAYEGKGFLSLTQADIIDNFYNIRNDIVKLSYAVYFADIINKTIPDEIENNDVLELLLFTLKVMSKTDFNIKLAARIFEIKYLQFSGFMPNIKFCALCEKNIESEIYFKAEEAMFFCHKCAKGVKLSNGAFKALDYILSHGIKELFKFNVSQSVLNELFEISQSFIHMYINEDFKTLKFAENITLPN